MSPLWHSVYLRACPRYGIRSIFRACPRYGIRSIFRACPRYDIRSTSERVPVMAFGLFPGVSPLMAFDQFSGRVPVMTFGLLPGVSPLWHSVYFRAFPRYGIRSIFWACPRYDIRSTSGRVPVMTFGLFTAVSPVWHSINFCNDLSWDVGLLHNPFITYFIRLVRSGHVPVMAFDVTPGMPPSWHFGFLSSKPSPMNSQTCASMLRFCIVYTNFGNFGSRIHQYINSNTMSHSLSTPYTILFIHSLLRLVLP